MTDVAVIGIGSPAGDDQAGWLVVDALRRANLLQRLPCTVRLLALDRPGARLIREFEDANVVVLVDATCSGAPPGSIRRIDRIECIGRGRSLSGHEFGVAPALQLAEALGLLPASIWIYGIEIQTAEVDGGPSVFVTAAANKLAQIIADELVQNFGAVPSSPAVG